MGVDIESIFRRSSKGIYYVYDLKSKKLTQIAENKIQEPTLSPNGNKVAYVFENNIYLKNLDSGKVTQVTTVSHVSRQRA